MNLTASVAIAKLEELIEKHGDQLLWHEDNECNEYCLSDIVYNENDDDFRVE